MTRPLKEQRRIQIINGAPRVVSENRPDVSNENPGPEPQRRPWRMIEKAAAVLGIVTAVVSLVAYAV